MTQSGNILGPDGQPINGLDEAEYLKKLEAVMKQEHVAELSGMLIRVFQLYQVVRTELMRLSGGMITDPVLLQLVHAMSSRATEPFSIAQLKKDLRDSIIPMLSSLNVMQFVPNKYYHKERPKDDSRIQPDADSGGTTEDRETPAPGDDRISETPGDPPEDHQA
jgi:hypothetical protein